MSEIKYIQEQKKAMDGEKENKWAEKNNVNTMSILKSPFDTMTGWLTRMLNALKRFFSGLRK